LLNECVVTWHDRNGVKGDMSVHSKFFCRTKTVLELC